MNDLISRQEAIDGINNICPVDTEYDCTLLDRVDVRCVLSDLPSAQPERKKGRWEYETMRHLITGEMRTVRICSVCDGGWFRYDMSDGVEEAEPNYCPNCGADMRGEEDGRSDK